jgi:TonB family protein
MTTIAQALSAALFHFIWQGTLVAFLLWIALLLLRNRTANARYAASCAAMALMAALPAITAWMLYRQPAALPIPATISTAIATSVPGAARIARESAPLAWIAIWRQWALPVWSVGVFVFTLRLALSCRHVAALRRLGHAAEGQIAETVALLARRMQAGRAIGVLISNAAESPSVVGWLRPAILLPAATLAGLEPQQLQAVLAHEIAHIRRHDYLVNLTQTLVETLLFYHPAVWWASACIRHERELCCDDAAVAVCGDAISYARALTSLERLRGMTPRLALGSTGGSLLYRIERLAGVKHELGPSKAPGIAALALGLACFAMTVHWAKAQQMTQQMTQQRQVPEEFGITVSTTGELLHRGRVLFPEAASKNGVEGTVMLEATLDQSGSVADAHVISGPPELRKAALQSVLQWQFANGWAGETQQVSITFQKAQMPAAQAFETERLEAQVARFKQENYVWLPSGADATQTQRSLELQYVELTRKLEDARKSLAERDPEIVNRNSELEAIQKKLEGVSIVGAPLARIQINGVPEDARAELTTRLTVKVGETLSQDSIDGVVAAVHAFDPRLHIVFRRAEDGGVALQITAPGAGWEIRK